MNTSKVSYFTENYYPYSAARLFAEKGYETESFHRGPDHVYNRGTAHPNWGYSEYYNNLEMNMAHSGYDTCLLPTYDEFVDGDKFMSFIITFSAHGPYEADYSLVKKAEDIIRPALPDDAEDEYVYSLCYAYETDQFIKGLFERMEADGTLDDTVVIFYTDHYDHYVTDNAIHEKYKGGTNEDLWCRVPFFIYSKDTEARSVDKVCASYDVLPTIANLFDLDTDGRYYFGNDAFSNGGGYVVFPDFSWYDGETYFDVNLDTPTDLSRERAKEISERFKMSWNTVKTDYFAKKAKK